MAEELVAGKLPVIDPAYSGGGAHIYRALWDAAYTRKRVCLVPQIDGAKWNRKSYLRAKLLAGALKEFAPSVGVFKDWKGKEEKRKKIFGALIKMIKEIDPLPIGCIFSPDDFRCLPEKDQKVVGDPYFLSFISCVCIPAFSFRTRSQI